MLVSTRTFVRVILVVVFLGGATPGPAAEDADKLAQCIVKSISESERDYIARWMFLLMSTHPSVESIVEIPSAELSDAREQVHGIFGTLLTDKCRAEAQRAIHVEGIEAFGQAYETLGYIAATELFSHGDVRDGLLSVSVIVNDVLTDLGIASDDAVDQSKE